MGNHALVFGATGMVGWGIVNEILKGYPSPDAFDKVTALANRPLTDNILWPETKKLQVVSGINLLTENGEEEVAKDIKSKIPDIDTVTHIFMCAYIFKLDPAEEIAINVKLLDRAVKATESLSNKIKFVFIPTGAKAYGMHLVGEFPFGDKIKLPLSEDQPRIPEPWQSQVFYYNMCDALEKLSKGKNWTWCEIRPDIIIGFVPNNNFYGFTQVFAIFLSLYKEIHGEGSECPFPFTTDTWENQISNDSSQDLIARFAIHCALNPETCGQGQAFNIADNSVPIAWKQRWPVLCEFFGLKGTPPPSSGEAPNIAQFLKDHSSQWKEMEKKYNLVSGRIENDLTLTDGLIWLLGAMNYDRRLDLSKCHKAWGGRAEEVDSYAAWWTAFERIRKARIIP